MPIDPHLVKEYRLKFECFFNARYTPRRPQVVDVNQYLIPFLEALGFTSYHVGPRYIPITNDPFQTLEHVGIFTLRARRKYCSRIEERAVVACAAAAVLFTLGHDETERYLAIEKEAVHRFRVDIDRIRVLGKDVYSAIMLRLDQYVTCSPITPIRWSRMEKRAYGFSKGGRVPQKAWGARARFASVPTRSEIYRAPTKRNA